MFEGNELPKWTKPKKKSKKMTKNILLCQLWSHFPEELRGIGFLGKKNLTKPPKGGVAGGVAGS